MQISCTKYYDLWGKKEEKVKAPQNAFLLCLNLKFVENGLKMQISCTKYLDLC